MKNKIYIIGLLAVITIVMGSVFKINHWPGAGILLMAGIFILCFLFMPLGTISAYRNEGKKNGWLYFAIFTTVFVDFVGALFKIMHWPGAGKLLYLGITFPVIVFLPIYLYHHFKSREDSPTNFLYVIFLLAYLSVMSALLSLNVSKEILTDALRIEKLNNYSDIYMAQFDQAELKKDVKTETLHAQTKDILEYINELKIELVLKANEKNSEAIDKDKHIDVYKIYNKDDLNSPSELLYGNNRAFQLKDKLDGYFGYLNKMESEINNLENNWQWEAYQLSGLPLVFVIQSLTDLENEIVFAESELMDRLQDKTEI